MLILSSTSDKIQIITGQAGSIDVHASYMDNASGTVTPGRKNTAITTATTTDVVLSPGASVQRNLKTLHISNKGTASVDITIQHTDGTTVSQLHKLSLPYGYTLQYIDEVGFAVSAEVPPQELGANLVINGAMEVSQESVSTAQTSVSTLKYIVDQFRYEVVGAAVVTLQQVTDAPTGFAYSSKVSVTTADSSVAATDKVYIYHAIEGYRFARLLYGGSSAQPSALGFWVKAHRTGIYTGAFLNSASNRSYTWEYTINAADTWEYKTIVVPGDTTGTWSNLNGVGVYIIWNIMIGSNFQQAAGSWQATAAQGTSNQVNGVAATTDTFQITGVSLVMGGIPISQDFSPIIVRPFQEELMLCQRYYEKSYNYTEALGSTGTNHFYYSIATFPTAGTWSPTWPVFFKVRKRAAPTLTLYSDATGASGKIRDVTFSADVTPTATATEDHVRLNATGGGSAQNFAFSWHYVADARL